MAKNVMQVHEFAKGLAAAGIVREEDLNSITRIVIDADASNGMVQIHITRIGDDPEKILSAIAPVMEGIFDGNH